MEKNLPHLVKAHSSVIKANKPSLVLEIASGFGQHIIAYAREHPNVTFQATECDDYLVSRLSENIKKASLSNLLPPRKLDVLNGENTRQLADCPLAAECSLPPLSSEQDWRSIRDGSAKPFDIITVTNLVNVAPWSVQDTESQRGHELICML